MVFEEIDLANGDVRAKVAPSRGALATALSVKDRQVLYLDGETLQDPSKSVRGGIPLLFPFAGSLANNRLDATGTSIKQHGFARNKVWQALEQRPGSLRLKLLSDQETQAVYPWEFELQHAFTLLPAGLLVELLILNKGDSPMPVAPGWHPYFPCAAAKKSALRVELPGVSHSEFQDQREFNFGVIPPADGTVIFQLPDFGRLRMRFSPEIRHVHFWSIPSKDFVCVEPFTGPPNFINTPAAHHVPPGEGRVYWMAIETL